MRNTGVLQQSKHTMISAITLWQSWQEKVISTHSDITKEDIEHSRHFPIIVVLYLPSGGGLQRTQQDCHSRDLPHGPKYRVQS
jgi:hypothetical protein